MNTRLNEQQGYLARRRSHWEQIATAQKQSLGLGRFYRNHLTRLYNFLVPHKNSVLELGCGRGDLLASLEPSRGVGVDFAPAMIEEARKRHPHLHFSCSEVSTFQTEEKFDTIILSDLLNDLWDVQELFVRIRDWCNPRTRIILNTFSRVWQAPMMLARKLGLATPMLAQNWLTCDDIVNLLHLEGYEVISKRGEMLFPFNIPVLREMGNRFLARIFPLHYLTLTHFIVARLVGTTISNNSTVTVVVPARNEEGNIRHIFERIPTMGGGVELIFVEGGSADGTYAAIEHEISVRPEMDARLFRQPGTGKGDAVRKGFVEARGDVLMILDADLTVSPEDLPRFFNVLAEGRAEFVNGVRLVYPQQDRAMRFLNFLGNKFFSLAFSWLLSRPIKDTLCGTKVIARNDYERIAAYRGDFADFDPFGDFELIFGAARLNLKSVDLPVRYGERTYGRTNISRWKHGWMLLKIFFYAVLKIKFI